MKAVRRYFDKTILIIILIFLLSVVIRQTNIVERPLAHHNEDAPAHVLVTLTAFEQNSVLTHKFLPIFTLAGGYNKGIDDLPVSARPDAKGNYFYASFPPFGFIAPYMFMKLLSLPISILSLRIFDLLTGLASALLLYQLVKTVFIGIAANQSKKIGVFASVVYIFNAESLWSHANSYWAHALLQPIWMGSLLVFFRIIDRKSTRRWYGLFAALVFLLCYTEWTGYVISGSFILASLYKYFRLKDKKYLYIIWITAASSVLSLSLMMSLFISTLGKESYFSALLNRVGSREGNYTEIIDVLTNYRYGFGFFLLLLLILMFIHLVRKYEMMSEGKSDQPVIHLFMFLTWFPLIENLILLNHARVYTFDTLKFAVPLSLTIAYVCYLIGRRYNKLIIALLFAAVIGSFSTYFEINDPALNNDLRYTTFEKVGNAIKNTIQPDEIAFINDTVRGHLIYYAGRNIVESTTTVKDAVDYLNNSSYSKGKLYIAGGNNYNVSSAEPPYPWLFYGELSGIFNVDKNRSTPSKITIFPALLTDENWINGLYRSTPRLFVHNGSVLEYFNEGDSVKNQNGARFSINKIAGDQIWFDVPEENKQEFYKSTEFVFEPVN